jgi:hypothetical protein
VYEYLYLPVVEIQLLLVSQRARHSEAASWDFLDFSELFYFYLHILNHGTGGVQSHIGPWQLRSKCPHFKPKSGQVDSHAKMPKVALEQADRALCNQ